MNVKTYAEVVVGQMRKVTDMEGVKSLVKAVVCKCGYNPEVVSLVLAHVADHVDHEDAAAAYQMFAAELPGVDSFVGSSIKNTLWFHDMEYIMGEPLVIPTSADKRAAFDAEWEQSLAELDAIHARNTSEMIDRHQTAVAAMLARFN